MPSNIFHVFYCNIYTVNLKFIMVKEVRDFSTKHFSRYGEFLVSFELAKHGWNVYSPLYDEYIDLVIHKFTCTSCDRLWIISPKLICSGCQKDFSHTEKMKIKAKKKCSECSHELLGNITKCPNCKSQMIPIPTCDKCGGEVEMLYHKCECGHAKYCDKIKTIQVKSSRIEYDKNGKSKNTYAADMKPKDMITSPNHFFIWCLVDDSDNVNFLVMSVDDFKTTMGYSMKGTSFFKDNDRQHFSSKNFGKWNKYRDQFFKLE